MNEKDLTLLAIYGVAGYFVYKAILAPTAYTPPGSYIAPADSQSDLMIQKAAGSFYNRGAIPHHTMNHGISAAGCSCQQ